MTRILLDTGPLVALVDSSERHHHWAREQFALVSPPLYTCEAVIAESVYLLASAGVDALAPLDLVSRGVLHIDFGLAAEHAAVRDLLARYAPRMDLADACLVRMSELHRDSRVLTLDTDFRIYRRNGRNVVPTLMPDVASPRARRRMRARSARRPRA
jgi:predicted nucleic acid-binding protein